MKKLLGSLASLLVMETATASAALTIDTLRFAGVVRAAGRIASPTAPSGPSGRSEIGAVAGASSCLNLAGDWTIEEDGMLRCCAQGACDSVPFGGVERVRMRQEGCEISYVVPSVDALRSGRVNGDRITLSGPLLLPPAGVQPSENTFSANGTATETTLSLRGSGRTRWRDPDLGVVITCTVTSSAEGTRQLPPTPRPTGTATVVRTITPTSTPTPTRTGITYVALGDSFSSGEGAGLYFSDTDTRSNQCHRSRRSYPTLVSLPDEEPLYRRAQHDQSVEWHMLACSGAETRHVRSSASGGVPRQGEPPQLDRGIVDAETDLVTITIGGNDAGFIYIVLDCLLYEACHEASPLGMRGDDRTYEELFPVLLAQVVRPRLDSLYRELRNATDADIVVLGYPRILAGRECPDAGFYFLGFRLGQLSMAEQLWIRRAVDQLNATIASAAAGAGLQFVGNVADHVADHFAEHEICGTKEPWLNGVRLSAEGFHPNGDGQAQYASLLNNHLASGSSAAASAAPEVEPAPAEVGAPDFGPLAVSIVGAGCRTGEFYVEGQMLSIAGDGFADGEAVEIYLNRRDTGRDLLGTVRADPAGRIGAEIQLPDAADAPSLALIEAIGGGPSGAGRLLSRLVALADRSLGDMDADADGVPDACDHCPNQPGGDRIDGCACPGDCNGDGGVTVDELIRGVNVALETRESDDCRALDANGDEAVAVNELVLAVNAALEGCDP